MTELDRVAFRIDNDSVAIEVNGRPLVELVGEVERPFAEREGSPNIAGAYAPLELRVLDSRRASTTTARRAPTWSAARATRPCCSAATAASRAAGR